MHSLPLAGLDIEFESMSESSLETNMHKMVSRHSVDTSMPPDSNRTINLRVERTLERIATVTRDLRTDRDHVGRDVDQGAGRLSR